MNKVILHKWFNRSENFFFTALIKGDSFKNIAKWITYLESHSAFTDVCWLLLFKKYWSWAGLLENGAEKEPAKMRGKQDKTEKLNAEPAEVSQGQHWSSASIHYSAIIDNNKDS